MKRIYHTWEKWECYPAGFYEETVIENGAEKYREFLSDIPRFQHALERVLAEWPHSCEHYLSNVNMNRIAWLGQAAMCIDTGVPARYRTGYHLLSKRQQTDADAAALMALNKWLVAQGEDPLTVETAESRTKANLY